MSEIGERSGANGDCKRTLYIQAFRRHEIYMANSRNNVDGDLPLLELAAAKLTPAHNLVYVLGEGVEVGALSCNS